MAPPIKDTPFLKKARERYKLANDADSKQDIRERDDIAFEDGEQWPVDIRLARQGQQPVNGMPAVPARPTLVIDKVKEPVRQILNQERQADIGIQITPADDFGDLGITPDDTEVLLREGLVRRIQRASHAADARTWAYKRAVIAGRGYYIVRTRYLPGRTYDQEIYVDRIYNQASVKLDPSHEKPDGSDAEWGFVGTWMAWDKFQAEYPKDADGKDNPFADCSEQEFMGLTESYPDWYRVESDELGRAVRIVDHWYTERTTRQIGLTSDGRVFYVGDVPDDATPEMAALYAPKETPFLDTRSVTEKTIQFCKIAGGVMELERTEEAGPNMPIVKVIGDEVLPYDEQRRYNGVIRPSKDAQMGLNYMVSKQVEVLGLSPLPTAQLDPEGIDGYEEWYKMMPTRALPFRPYRTYDDQGRQLAQPTWNSGNPDIYPIAQSVAMFDQAIKSTTAVPDSTLGNVDPSLKSGKAIQAVVQNAAMSTSNYLDNLKRSMEYEAQIINGKLYPIYGARPGRLVRILTGEGEEQTLAVGAPPADPRLQQKATKVAKLTKDAQFNIIAKIAKNSENRRQQFVEMFSQLLASDPTQMSIAGDLFYKNLDIPEARQLAERQKTMLAQPVQAMLAAKESGGQPDPKMEQAQAQIQQLHQQLQQAQAEIQSGMQAKQLDAQTRLQIAQMEIQSKEKIAVMETQAQLSIKQGDLEQRRADAVMEAEVKALDIKAKMAQATLADKGSLRDTLSAAHAQGRDHAHEVGLTAMEQQHEQQQAAQQAAMASQEPPA